jgi:glycosyltransferase involved in cell wall biosynthesis
MYFTDSSGFGGAEQVLLTLMAGLDPLQWRLVLVHHLEPGVAELSERAAGLGLEVHALPSRVRGGLIERASEARALLRLIRMERPDIFHANLAWPLAGRYALLTAAAASVPAVVATVHSFGVTIPPRKALVQRVVNLAVSRYIAISRFVSNRLASSFSVPTQKLSIVPNGIRFDSFAPRPDRPAMRAWLGRGFDRPIVLTPARLDPVKGHAFLLEAAAELPDVAFVLAGDGPERKALGDQADRLGIGDRVLFLGQRADIGDLLANCDLVVLPSLSEGFGLAAIEAMIAGAPVLATTAGALPEIIRDGVTGMMVPPANPSALASSIRTLLGDRMLARRLAEAGRDQAQREFGAERMVERVTAVYLDVLRQRGHRMAG